MGPLRTDIDSQYCRSHREYDATTVEILLHLQKIMSFIGAENKWGMSVKKSEADFDHARNSIFSRESKDKSASGTKAVSSATSSVAERFFVASVDSEPAGRRSVTPDPVAAKPEDEEDPAAFYPG